MYRFGEFELDPRRHELRHRGSAVKLAPQPFRLLLALAEAKGALVTREALGRKLWDEGTFVDAEAGINFCIRTLRRALAEAAGVELTVVETVPRLGYRLALEVLSAEAGEAPVVPPVEATIEATAEAKPSTAFDPSLSSASAARAGASEPVVPSSVSAPVRVAAEGARSRVRVGLGLAAAAAVAIAAVLFLAAARARGRDLAVVVTSDDGALAGPIAKAFEAEVVGALLGSARESGQIFVDGAAVSSARSRLDAHFFEIPAGARAEFRLSSGANGGSARAVVWQWTIELSPHSWFYGRSTIAEGVARETARRLWSDAPPVDSALAARLDFWRARLDAREPRAAEATLAELEPLSAGETDRSATSNAALLALIARARLASWDVDGCERAARRAIELDPELGSSRLALALSHSVRGRHAEAMREISDARRLAPLDGPVQVGYARVMLYAGNTEEAVRATDAALVLFPEVVPLWRTRYLAFLVRGETSKAGQALARVLRLSSDPLSAERARELEEASLAVLREEWRDELEGRRGSPTESPASRAALHALLGESDAALAELERSIEAREESAIFVGISPSYASLRPDPRFQELVRRIEGARKG